MKGFLLNTVRPIARLCLSQNTRLCYSVWKIGDKWPRLTDEHRHAIDTHWAPRITEMDQQPQNLSPNKEKCYVLSMFPYPSGKLHMGHLRVYTVSDVLARFQRLRGYDVIQPMGWDAFGLPAENAAIDRNLKPEDWTYNNIADMKRQMQEQMCLSIDWSRELATCSPQYYKWTQWIFLRLLEHGLAYRKSAEVNWDPVDNTVLADELIDDEGRSWRSGALVEKRQLEQWYFRTSAYSESLLKGLNEIDGNQWRNVIQAQKGWIGDLDGTFIDFSVQSVNARGELEDKVSRISVFTRQPSLVYLDAISHIAINSDSLLYSTDLGPTPPEENPVRPYSSLYSKRCAGGKIIIQSRLADPLPVTRMNVVAIHPITHRKIPIVYRPDLQFLPQECLDSEFGIPDISDCDRLIAEENEFEWRTVLNEDGLIQCDSHSTLNGQSPSDAFHHSLKLWQEADCGGHPSSSLRRDWLISRQRYWGTPIPIIYCDTCGVVPVPESQLPVTLPILDKFSGRGLSPLLSVPDWVNTNCPQCTGPAKRETDTMDTFVDSSWYFLRYLDAKNQSEICDKEMSFRLMPVDIYIGGIEHAIRHLFYARFISHFLFDIGYLPEREPFRNFLPIGLVLGKTYQVKKSGKYLCSDEIEKKQWGKKQMLVEATTGLEVKETWDKMSKSKYNGIDPEEVVARYGKDTVRLCMLTNAGPHRSRKWQEGDVILGVMNWQNRLFKLIGPYVDQANQINFVFPSEDPLTNNTAFAESRSLALRDVLHNYEETFILSNVVARLQSYSDVLKKLPKDIVLKSPLYAEGLCDLVVMLSPVVPLFSSELWAGLQHVLLSREIHQKCKHFPYDMNNSVLQQRFPEMNIPIDQKSSHA